jgi:hypothetical protein
MNREEENHDQAYVKKNIQAFRLTWSERFVLV